jgi:hypothetical protein
MTSDALGLVMRDHVAVIVLLGLTVVGAAVSVGIGVGVNVAVGVLVGVGVAVGVLVGVLVFVGVRVGVEVSVAMGNGGVPPVPTRVDQFPHPSVTVS